MTNSYLQTELKLMQNRNEFFNKLIIEAKEYINTPTESQLELLCIFPNKIFEFNQTPDAFLWIKKCSLEYYKLFPLENFDKKTIYQSFICIRNKWIKYGLAEWIDSDITHYIIPDKTIQFFSKYSTENELADDYLSEGFLNYTFEYNFEKSKQIKDPDLCYEWRILYTNSTIYKYHLYDLNR